MTTHELELKFSARIRSKLRVILRSACWPHQSQTNLAEGLSGVDELEASERRVLAASEQLSCDAGGKTEREIVEMLRRQLGREEDTESGREALRCVIESIEAHEHKRENNGKQ